MSGYAIMVGRERPMEVMSGKVDKNGMPEGSDHVKGFVQVGRHLPINPTEAWGRRVVNGKPVTDTNGKEVLLEHTDARYKGEIEFLPWGDPRGMLLVSRWLRKSSSLDQEYQDNVQKIKIDKEKGEDGSAQLELYSGENKFDPKTDALLIQHLKVHSGNRDSVSKNPDPKIKGYSFYEVTEDNVKTNSIEHKEKGLDAGIIVKTAAKNSADLRTLLKILGKREDITVDDLSKDKQIYDELLTLALSKPNDLISLVDNWKREISDAFELAKSFKALDLTKDGHIALIIDNKAELMYSDVKGKGEAMIMWVMENSLDSEVYKTTQNFISKTQKLK